MISFRLKEIAERLGKNISEIAQDTGLNRNTITALYHGRIDGIKFVTLEKLCEVYKIKIEDLLVHTPRAAKEQLGKAEKVYKQEGEVVPFTMWVPLFAIGQMPKKYFKERFGKTIIFWDKEYFFGYWHQDAMTRVARSIYERYSAPTAFDSLYADFLRDAEPLQKLYVTSSQEAISSLGSDDFLSYFTKVCEAYRQFWRLSIFIDGFDAGFDQEKIQSIAEKHRFSIDEVAILTTPERLTFGNERLLALLKIVKPLRKNRLPEHGLTNHLRQFVVRSEAVRAYIKEFDYYKSNYAKAAPITNEEVVFEILKYLKDADTFQKEYHLLTKHRQNQAKKIKQVLTKHALKQNPLYFFQQLTYWREYRKKINLMGILVMFRILHSLEERTGIPLKYLSYLSLDEVPAVLKGLVTKQALQQRYEGNMLVIADENGYKILVGDEARSINDELSAQLVGEPQQATINGSIASQGYAKGIARIILNVSDFAKFKEGEILVTGMTRPEFVPLMKKAAGIVTNEGGITCHAAIVSRELGKPCIIGTQVATQLIRDGDLVEVRAYHGTVRILERSK